jgi:hypothetical protein
MLEADFGSGKLYAHTREGVRELFDLSTEQMSKHTHLETMHFLDCIETGATPLTDGPGSLQGLRVIWRLYEAERRGVVADLRGLGLDESWDQPGLARLPE